MGGAEVPGFSVCFWQLQNTERGASRGAGQFVVRAREAEEQATRFSHPWNPNSELFGTRLSSLVGLGRVGVSRMRMPPGKESFVYHSHYRDEEWTYVLSGRGVSGGARSEGSGVRP